MLENTVAARLLFLAEKVAGGRYSKLAEMLGSSSGTFIKYVRGERLPPAETLAKIREVTGCDLNWLVMGEGTAPGEKEEGRAGMVAEGLAGYCDARPAPLDVDLLADALQSLEEVSEEAGLKLTPAEKAARVALIYQLEQERKAKLSPEAVRRLVKLS